MQTAALEEPGKRARNQAARRERVIEAAMALATDGGYEAVQMREVADRAGVALGTLYRYFPSKDELLVAALGQWATALRERLRQKPARGQTAADRVADVLRRATRALERAPRLSGALVAALSSADPTVAEAKRAVYDILHDMITEAMDGGASGIPPSDRDDIVRVLGYVWFAALVAWAGGMAQPGAMGDELATAARLLLKDG